MINMISGLHLMRPGIQNRCFLRRFFYDCQQKCGLIRGLRGKSAIIFEVAALSRFTKPVVR